MQCKNWTLKWTIIISVGISASWKSKSSPLTPSKYAIRIHTLLSATLLLYMLLRPPVHRNIAYNKEYTFLYSLRTHSFWKLSPNKSSSSLRFLGLISILCQQHEFVNIQSQSTSFIVRFDSAVECRFAVISIIQIVYLRCCCFSSIRYRIQ